MTPKIDIVALGELLIDFTTVSADEAGYPTMAAHPGGAPANFLAAAARCGLRTALLGKVGADTFGDLLVNTLRTAGIETRGILRDGTVFTTLAFVTLDAQGDRSFAFARKPGADTKLWFEELDRSLIDEAKVFHFGSLSLTDQPARAATKQAVEYAKAKGKLITFDPNLRKPLWANLEFARQQMLWGLARADVVKISDEEAEFLFGSVTPAQAAQIIRQQYGAQLVFVTCGAAGCWFDNGKACGMVPALAGVKPVDTTGAGDMFGGSAVAQLLRTGKAPQDLTEQELLAITRYACAAAGLSTQQPGGISSVPTARQVEQALAQG